MSGNDAKATGALSGRLRIPRRWPGSERRGVPQTRGSDSRQRRSENLENPAKSPGARGLECLLFHRTTEEINYRPTGGQKQADSREGARHGLFLYYHLFFTVSFAIGTTSAPPCISNSDPCCSLTLLSLQLFLLLKTSVRRRARCEIAWKSVFRQAT